MGFADLKYGWTHEVFDLVDVAIHRTIQLEVKSDDGNWEDRDATLIADEATLENGGELRFAEVQGWIRGKAQFSDFMDQMILGVPEDKTDSFTVDKNRISSIEIDLRVVTDEDFKDLVRKGRVQFSEASDYHDEHVSVTVFITVERFNDICRIATEPDVSFQIGLNFKCWHWTGPIGDGKIFFKMEGHDPAELAFIATSRKVACQGKDEDDQQNVPSR